MRIRYKVLDWKSANKLKHAKSTSLLLEIEYNLARVYLLNNWTFLVVPLNPIGNSLLTDNQELVQKWIKERYFPAGDEEGKLYRNHPKTIDDLMNRKEGLKKSLRQYVAPTKSASPISSWEIDDLYEILKNRKLYDKFKLPFIVLLGDYIISRQEGMEWHWGLLRARQYLNPQISLVLVQNVNTSRFYDLEDQLAKRDFPGVDYYLKAFRNGIVSQINKQFETIEIMEPTHIQL